MSNTTLTPLRNCVFVSDMKKGERKIGRIILKNDDGKAEGIRPRWGKVHAVGPDVNVLEVGDWVLIDHGRWTRELNIPDYETETPLHQIEYPESVLLMSKEEPEDDMIGSLHTDFGQKYREF